MPLRATRGTTTAVVLAGSAWAAPARAAAPATDFEVCGQRGCAAHRVAGTITWGPAGSVKAAATDRGPGASTFKFTVTTPTGTSSKSYPVSEGTVGISFTAADATRITVSVCNVPTTLPCPSETYTP